MNRKVYIRGKGCERMWRVFVEHWDYLPMVHRTVLANVGQLLTRKHGTKYKRKKGLSKNKWVLSSYFKVQESCSYLYLCAVCVLLKVPLLPASKISRKQGISRKQEISVLK